MPPATVALVVLNLLAYLLELAAGGAASCAAHGLVPARFVQSGDLGPVLTQMFLHDPAGLSHIAGNMAFLALFGTLVERSVGGWRFLVLYLGSGVAGGLLHVLVDPAATDPLVGASGAIFGVLAVAGALDRRLLGFAAAFLGLNVWYALAGTGGAVSSADHIGGFAVGTLFALAARATDHRLCEET
jgi:membrane associated rhomboid family serine protease